MAILYILLGSMIVFRALGFLGIFLFQTWQESTVCALAVMFCFTGFAHFGPLRNDLQKMLPPWVPKPKEVIFLTGILEILGAIGLIIPETRWSAGICLILFLLAVFPANVHAAKTDVQLGGKAVTPLGVRGPMQVMLILLLFWTITK
jgi:uncharacterized membrane protein